jgi:hypothetical protein
MVGRAWQNREIYIIVVRKQRERMPALVAFSFPPFIPSGTPIYEVLLPTFRTGIPPFVDLLWKHPTPRGVLY